MTFVSFTNPSICGSPNTLSLFQPPKPSRSPRRLLAHLRMKRFCRRHPLSLCQQPAWVPCCAGRKSREPSPTPLFKMLKLFTRAKNPSLPIFCSGVGCGLRNVGNSCYLNAATQCLAYAPPLINWIRSLDHQRECRVNGFCSLCALCRLVSELHESRQAVTPSKFISNLKRIAPSLRAHRQEDAHEYLRHLLDNLQGSAPCGSCSFTGKNHLSPCSLYQVFRSGLSMAVLVLPFLPLSSEQA